MMAKKYIELTRVEAAALRARINAALGYPRTPTIADRVGGGSHTPLEDAITQHAVAIRLHPTDGTKALVMLRDAWADRLRAAEQSALLDEVPAEYDDKTAP